MALQDILFLDIETVSQYENFSIVPDNYKKLWEKQVLQSYRDLLNNKLLATSEELSRLYTEKAAFHAEFSKIICASVARFVFKNGEGVDVEPTLKVKAIYGDEDNILKIISTVMSLDQDPSNPNKKPIKSVCSHNGKKFDFPFTARRFIIRGMQVPKILDIRDMKPWDSQNIDTQDLWRFGDMVYPSLELLCTCLNIPVKTLLDGSMIHDAYHSGKIQTIANHCNEDVIALAKLYVKIKAGLDVNNIEVC